MITKLAIEGFQSLDGVLIELGSFTVLVGPSNSGKSAIRRAIEALVDNDPVTGRLREGSTQYAVAMEVDGEIVSITKTKKTTSYRVRDTLIDKPGATCPPAVLELLKLTETNFASQFDQPFLLAETSSAVARALGELTNISVLFEGIREATRRQRAAGGKAKIHAEQVDVLADKLAVYADLPTEQDQLQQIHGKLIVAADTVNRAKALHDAVIGAEYARQMRDDTETLLKAQPDWDYLEGTAVAIETTLSEAAMAEAAWQRGAQLDLSIMDLRDELANIAVPEIDFPTLEAWIAQAGAFWRAHQAATMIEATARTADAAMISTEDEIQAAAELATLDRCPLCGALISTGDLCA